MERYISTVKYFKKRNTIIKQKHKMRHSDYLFIPKLRQLEIYKKVGNLKYF